MPLLHHIRWRPGIGDPSWLGWVTVGAYAVAAAACGWTAWRLRPTKARPSNHWRVWLVMALVMTGLGVNKQLDLQSLITDIGRAVAREQGWYRERKPVQRAAVLTALAVSAVAAVAGYVRYRTFWKAHWLLCWGVVLLGTFVAVRAISFHHVDVLLRTRVIGVRVNVVLELTGITLITLSACRAGRLLGDPR
jgi:hypothetical protein